MSQSEQGTAKKQTPKSEVIDEREKGNAGRSEQNPGTSRGQQQDWTGTVEERGRSKRGDGTNDESIAEETDNQTDSTIRNPSGDDLSDAVDGDEGSRQRF